jgi:hypothetical protein
MKRVTLADDQANRDNQNLAAIDSQTYVTVVRRQFETPAGSHRLTRSQQRAQRDLLPFDHRIVSSPLSVLQVDILCRQFTLRNAPGAAENTEGNIVNRDVVLRRPFHTFHRNAPIVTALWIVSFRQRCVNRRAGYPNISRVIALRFRYRNFSSCQAMAFVT